MTYNTITTYTLNTLLHYLVNYHNYVRMVLQNFDNNFVYC